MAKEVSSVSKAFFSGQSSCIHLGKFIMVISFIECSVFPCLMFSQLFKIKKREREKTEEGRKFGIVKYPVIQHIQRYPLNQQRLGHSAG